MPKTIRRYEEVEDIVGDVLKGTLPLEITFLMKHGDWDAETLTPDTEIGTSAFSLESILNKLMESKDVPIRFKIRLK